MPARFGVSPRLAVAALALACALAVPLRLSADVWAYAAYGALLGHGADPWSHAYRAADVARFADPLLNAALRAWDGSLPRDVYGPLFTGACALVVAATRPFGPGGAVFALRLLAAGGLLACIALAGRRGRGSPRCWRTIRSCCGAPPKATTTSSGWRWCSPPTGRGRARPG